MKAKATILLSNDDGIDAPGILALRDALKSDYHIIVSAPMMEKSGSGCALSLATEIALEPRKDNHGNTWGYAVDGTPADSVKMAFGALEVKPDLVISGINRGMNIGNSVFYSGTVSCAIEASFYGARAIATSLACWGFKDELYAEAAKFIKDIVPWLLDQPVYPRRFWNLNLPNVKYDQLKGIRLTDHGTSFFMDDFELYRQSGDRLIYRNVGTELVGCDATTSPEEVALDNGECSLSLLSTDLFQRPDASVVSKLANYTTLLKGSKSKES